MKIAISGQHGFLGSHLSKALLVKDYQVVPISQELLYSPSDLREFFGRERPDYIFHLAAYGNMSFQKDPAQIVFSNIIGTFNMLNESKHISYRGFINFGSSSEYGKKYEAMKEHDVLVPETFYGASKASATHLSYVFAKEYEKPIVTVRPFSVYGPGEADFRFIPTVIRSMLEGKSFPLDVKATHDWIYIDDIIKGILIVMDKINNIGERVINIGSGRTHTNKEVCELLKKITGIQYLATPIEALRRNDSEVWLSDNTLITQLGFYPSHMLQEGLQKTYDYYKSTIKAKNN